MEYYKRIPMSRASLQSLLFGSFLTDLWVNTFTGSPDKLYYQPYGLISSWDLALDLQENRVLELCTKQIWEF